MELKNISKLKLEPIHPVENGKGLLITGMRNQTERPLAFIINNIRQIKAEYKKFRIVKILKTALNWQADQNILEILDISTQPNVRVRGTVDWETLQHTFSEQIDYIVTRALLLEANAFTGTLIRITWEQGAAWVQATNTKPFTCIIQKKRHMIFIKTEPGN